MYWSATRTTANNQQEGRMTITTPADWRKHAKAIKQGTPEWALALYLGGVFTAAEAMAHGVPKGAL